MLAIVSPRQIRAYSQHCVNGHEWLKITTTEAPDQVCPYCATADLTSTIHWTLYLPQGEEPSSGS